MGAPAASRPAAARGPRALLLPRGECWLEGLRELRNGARGPFAGGGAWAAESNSCKLSESILTLSEFN